MNISLSISKITLALTVGIASLLVLTSLLVPAVSAQDFKNELCGGANLKLTGGSCKGDEAKGDIEGIINTIVTIFSVIVGIVAVIMIIIAGFKFVTSGGDSNKIASARSTIVYAIVGLIVVALAQVIVRFVLNKVG